VHEMTTCGIVGRGMHQKQTVNGFETIVISLNDEELAAVEGWRAANLLDTKTEAIRELVRLGLLSEIAKVHQLVNDLRASVDNGADDGASLRDQ